MKFLDEFRRSALGFTLQIALLSRVAIFAVGLIASVTFGPAIHDGAAPETRFRTLPAHWDADWYMGIAGAGYRWEGPDRANSRLAFFPAYPLTLRAVGRVFGLPDSAAPWLWTGVGISVVCFWLGLFFLYRLAEILGGVDAARASVLVAAAYPFALFHGQVYPESLFLLAAAAATYYVWQAQYVPGLAFGVIAGLTRPTGSLLVFLLLWAAMNREQGGTDRRPAPPWLKAIAVIGPAIGTGIYSVYIWWLTGSPFTWMTDQERWGRTIGNPLERLYEPVAAMAAGPMIFLTTRPYDALNMGAAIVAIAGAVYVWRRIGWGPAVFTAASVLAPLIVGGLASMGRYTCVLFPLFIAWGLRARGGSAGVLVALAIAQGLLAALFFTDRPVF